MLKLLALYNEIMLENASKNTKYTSPSVQKEILNIYPSKVQKSIRFFFVENSKLFCSLPPILNPGSAREWACTPMVGRSGGTLPTRVQILVLAPFPEFIPRYSDDMR
jgi:hypothetical protein